jgi:CRISPR/Cas system-associated exonuclease Cas4 (RecB family)
MEIGTELAVSAIENLPVHSEDSTKFTGSQINYYFICKRKLWFF